PEAVSVNASIAEAERRVPFSNMIYVVNIARGSVVDTAALEAAIRAGRLGGAGLDVYESEPAPPAGLLDLEQVVLTPHIAGWSPESIAATVDRFLENARLHLAGEAVVSPV
ncbi:NAD(P)-dependent oxidoreductase, partial [Ralstonia pseudosolanacearum]|uniref:NAD(P)-dependent oxidoreductase n=1 Tax=Ralstonia pseudosolanacearum TaxID=1310165 RepID=UPI003CF54C4D